MGELGRAAERMTIGVGVGAVETGRHCTRLVMEKWDAEQITWTRRKDRDGLRLIRPGTEPAAAQFRAYRCLPFDTYVEDDCNLVLNAGWQAIMNGIAGSTVTKLANGTVGRIGGGISGTAPAATQTDLQAATGSTNRQWEVINAVPTVGSTGAAGLILAAQFGTSDGNFTWAEFGLDSGTTAGTGASVAPMYTRGTASPGTKTSAQTWNATLTITWS